MDSITGELKTTINTGKWKDEYDAYIASPDWASKREQRLKIDNYICSDCGNVEKLQVHHKTYIRLKHELMDDLITLCDGCHTKRHWPFLTIHPTGA
jgi:5-methylcytosine-specific restriction endonuclease McrA